MNARTFTEVISALADQQLHQVRGKWNSPPIASWFQLHGWDVHDEEHQRLALRQALLDLAVRRLFPHIETFPTPLDHLVSDADLSQLGYISDLQDADAGFLGRAYATLVPQGSRRHIGQFWTEDPIAEWMTAWLLQSPPQCVLDIGCGSGNFLLKLAERISERRLPTQLKGLDVSPIMLNVAAANSALRGLPKPHLELADYLHFQMPRDVDSVVCNPPYTRHHDIPSSAKAELQSFFKQRFGVTVSRQATMASHFLLKIIADLSPGARAAFIAPMEVLDARYGKTTRHILCRYTTLAAVIHFSEEMNAFKNVDVGACILLFTKKAEEGNLVKHIVLNALPRPQELLNAINAPKPSQVTFARLTVLPQHKLYDFSKWFSIGQSQRSHWEDTGLVVPLKELASIMRGIATGANDFFALPSEELARRRLESYAVRTIQRNREIQDIVLDETHWKKLSAQGKRVWLLYVNGESIEDHPALREYIREGERLGFSNRSLVKTRRRWFMMEQREIPLIFFTILTRGNPRFILNKAEVRPLNMFSLIYPKPIVVQNKLTDILWALLNSEFSLSKLHSVSRTYGGRTLKVEPRELDNLPVVNPLALSEDQRERLRGLVGDYFDHRDTAAFTRNVSDLVKGLLSAGLPRPARPMRMRQLVLCESPAKYRAKAQNKNTKRGKPIS